MRLLTPLLLLLVPGAALARTHKAPAAKKARIEAPAKSVRAKTSVRSSVALTRGSGRLNVKRADAKHFAAPHSMTLTARDRGVARRGTVKMPNRELATGRPAPLERRTRELASLQASPSREPAAPSEPAESSEPIVHHDRKIHHAAEPEAPETPQKVSSADFLTPFPAPAAVTAAPAYAQISTALRVTPVAEAIRRPPLKISATPVSLPLPAPVPEPALYSASGRLIVPPALKGSHEILVHQNEMADSDGLNRIQDDADLDRMRSAHLLAPLPAGPELISDERLPLNRRYCRPWTAQFLAALARAHYQRFHTPLQVNSAVRTVEFQERLIRTNGNAAPAEGETASPHLTGQAVDLAKHGLSMTEIAWMRGYLLPLVQQGKIDVEEEFQQSCFHISVYRKYMPQSAPPRSIIPGRRASGSALAVAIP